MLLNISESIISISDKALSGLNGFSVSADNKFFSAQNNVLYNSDKSEIIKVCENASGSFAVQNYVTKIADYAFINCEITSLTIGESVVTIGQSILRGCENLVSLTVAFIGDSAFLDDGENANVDNVTIDYFFGEVPQSLSSLTVTAATKITSKTFLSCINLTSIVINGSITEAPKGYLEKCKKLESVVLPFAGTKLDQVSTLVGKFCFAFGSLGSAIPETLKSITITGGKVLAASVFAGCDKVEQIILPKTLETIEKNAFSSCEGLTKIFIPLGVLTFVDMTPFESCIKLTIYCERDKNDLEWDFGELTVFWGAKLSDMAL